ncbi:MAG TPA: alpha-L-fucosidase [Fimbriimonadaceae bacterium]|nr:alpha-L-fucosidase [Fimbriimonadaceae bacterium]
MLALMLMAAIQLPTPSPRQLAWHDLETYAFVHFGPNTFTGEEWGHGREDPRIFNPTNLDCDQWARTFKSAGLKAVIITAKHHDGFCLWPSRYSAHTVARSPWKNGRGDVLRELSEACRKHGLRFGVYLSPWDRNHPTYGTPQYNEIFAKMLREVLTSYGPVFEVWFDGANGEGPNGKRQVYDWELFVRTVRECQPNAVIFSDAGPDVRWVGNERGYASETNWATLRRDEFFPGTPRHGELGLGHEDGAYWVPAECDVSIRPGWFWRASEDDKVKSVKELVEIYFASVGRGGSLLLNVPPNREGVISDVDARRLQEWRMALDREFRHEVVTTGIEQLRDGKRDTFMSAAEPLQLEVPGQAKFDRIILSEAIQFGQRVRAFRVEALVGGAWTDVASGTTIGPKRILRVPPVAASAVRVTMTPRRPDLEPRISELRLFRSEL